MCGYKARYVNDMADEIGRMKLNWTGFTGAPGYSNFYFRDFSEGDLTQAMVTGFASRLELLIATIQSRLPSTVTIQLDPTVDVIDVPTGNLTRFMNFTPNAARTGQATGNYSAASGAVINWYTGGVYRNRRVRGRTFLVPYGGSALGPNGTLDDTLRTSLIGAINTFLAVDATKPGVMGIYARPQKAHTNKAGEQVPATPGAWFSVTSFTHPDKVAVLRSRRD